MESTPTIDALALKEQSKAYKSLSLAFGIFLPISGLIDWLNATEKGLILLAVKLAIGIVFIGMARAYRDYFNLGFKHLLTLYVLSISTFALGIIMIPKDLQTLVLVPLIITVFGFFGTALWKPANGMIAYVAGMAIVAAFIISAPLDVKGYYTDLGLWFLASTLVAPLFISGTIWSKFKKVEDFDTILKDADERCAAAEKELADLELHVQNQNHKENRILRVAVHDINNRIASLMNLNSLFEIKFKKMHEESLLNYNKKLEEIAAELKVFTNNLVAPKNEKDYPEIQIAIDNIELKPLLESVVDELRTKAGNKGVSLSLIQTNKELFLDADKTYLKVVLRNLLNYAIKFSQNNNQVIVSTSKKFDKIYLEIMDKSRGLEKETLERMFSYLPENIKDKMEDTTKGIGLSVAKYLAEKMGGRIHFESSVELGLHFSLIFDVVDPVKVNA